MVESIKNKTNVVLITGAGHGIGRVLAHEFAKTGAKIAVLDLSNERGTAVCGELQSQGFESKFFKLDLREQASIARAISAVAAHFGCIDTIINNARPRLTICGFEKSLEEWDLAMSVLLTGPAHVIAQTLPHIPKEGGNIINIVSVASTFVSQQPAAYHVAKAGLVQLTKVLAVELATRKIRVNAVCPGIVDLYDENAPLTANPLNRLTTEMTVPMGRAARAEEIASCAVFLCSAAASYVNGHVLHCDGGETLRDHFHIVREALQVSLKEKA